MMKARLSSPVLLCRFSTLHREYRYFIAQRGLDLTAMRVAAAHLVGPHDFRNFCKLDVEHVHSFERTILACEVLQLPPHAPGTAAEVPVCVLHVRGTAFLWHQVTLKPAQRPGTAVEVPLCVLHVRGTAFR